MCSKHQPKPTEPPVHNDDVVKREAVNGGRDRLLTFLVIGVMPFLYGAATRLPFIYFVIHLAGHFNLDWWPIGLCVGAYQGCRVVVSAASIVAPKTSHFLGTAAGLAGYITVFISDKDLVMPFVAGTAVIGFSETMSSMQKYAKEMFKLDPDHQKSQLMFKYQYAAVMCGVVFAFSIGGVVYQKYSINGVAMFGIIIEGSGLLALVVYAALLHERSWRMSMKGGEHRDTDTVMATTVAGNEDKVAVAIKHDIIDSKDIEVGVEVNRPSSSSESKERDDFVDHPIQTKETLPQTQMEDTNVSNCVTTMIDSANANYPTADLPATWVNYLVCVSFGIEALTIGYNLSIGPIFILNQFQKGTGVIGILFAVGAASGTVVAVGITCTEVGRNLMLKIASAPFDLCFAMGGIAVGVFVAAVPNFEVHVCGLVLLMAFNDLGATLMTELQASITTVSTFSVLGPLGQVVRRSLNVITAVSGPVLFGIYPRLPYIVAGAITLLWTVFLAIAFKLRMESTLQEVADHIGMRWDSLKPKISFRTSEVVRSSIHGSIHGSSHGSARRIG